MTLTSPPVSHPRQANYLAVVASKSGTTVTVRRYGDPATAGTQGPYPCEAGVSGFVQVGDPVIVDRSTGQPIVKMPVEQSHRANMMQRVGADATVGETSSHTDWVTLQDVSGLAIPATAAMEIFFTAQGQGVGTPGTADRELRLVLNAEAGIALSFASSSLLTVGERVFVSPLATGFATPLRYVAGQVGAWTYGSLEGEISRVRLQGKTGDTEQENDILRAQGLAVFA